MILEVKTLSQTNIKLTISSHLSTRATLEIQGKVLTQKQKQNCGDRDDAPVVCCENLTVHAHNLFAYLSVQKSNMVSSDP